MCILKVKRINGNEVIKFLEFNVDGKGNALVLVDNEIELWDIERVLDTLLGRNAKEKEYELCD